MAMPKMMCAASVTETNRAVRGIPKTPGYGVKSIPSSNPAAMTTAHAQLPLATLPIIATYMMPKVMPLPEKPVAAYWRSAVCPKVPFV